MYSLDAGAINWRRLYKCNRIIMWPSWARHHNMYKLSHNKAAVYYIIFGQLTPERRKAELATLAESQWTVYTQSGHMSNLFACC